MITMTTSTVCDYIKSKFPDLAQLVKNGNIDKRSQKSIGVFLGSDTRLNGSLAIGGIDCTIVRMLPANVNVRWTDSQKEHDDKATELYNAMLLESNNFLVNDTKIACIQLLDGCPVSLGRDDKNVCESVIRANFYYYI